MPTTIIQLTDCHLFADESSEVYGSNPQRSFHSVVDLLAAQATQPDLVLATGDISNDYSEASYLRFVEGAQTLGAPLGWIPGNHDDPVMMNHVAANHASRFAGSPTATPAQSLRFGEWKLLLLNSHVSGRVSGQLGAEALAFLEQELKAGDAAHIVICLHHQPMTTDYWMDRVMLENWRDFQSIVDRCPLIRAIVFGHIHQAFDHTRNGIRLLAAPATSCQFKPESSEFGLDDRPPGYRWFLLGDSGEFTTGVERTT